MKERRTRVLELVAESYIATAHPVASGHIAARLEVSPATVRYDFGSLESAGLLQQPHTSAGRIPTALGFRVYAKSLLPPRPLRAAQQSRLDEHLKGAEGDDLLALASRLAAELSGYAVTIHLPADDALHILEIHLSQLASNRLLAVVVLENGLVRQLGVTVDPAPHGDVIDDAERNLRQLAQPVGEVPSALLELANRADAELSRTLVALARAWHDLQPPRVFREGFSHLLDEPEGADPSFMRLALESLESESRNASLRGAKGMSDYADASEPVPPAGAAGSAAGREPAGRGTEGELFVDLDERVARVGASFSLGRSSGHLAIVGPARMRYPETLSVAQGLARALERPGRA
ncbi:MAG: DeoR family transcriptional regulator [Trueperaceae bacterium]|nr:DeoR family transcriptional regulator [Trueperaceae bacterium]MCC6311971.1 DeoR family transcriptional regulator [Trueperaceae bacterium]MCO5172765.1 DeoR family transcriptional regulator [Trueperaceae bacterium]MCW5820986.1 DeoR family transcriptional regulator [Trueperaceae bacterium]